MGIFRRKKKVAKLREVTYTSPLSGILSNPPQDDSCLDNEPTPQEIADLLLECGVLAHCPDAVAGASVIQYYFRLNSLKDFAKARRSAAAVGARLGRKVTFSDGEQHDFTLCIERKNREIVHFKTALLTYPFANNFNREPACIFGTDVQGKTVIVDISKLPHLLIAGTTGSGKSVLLHSIICSLLFKVTPFDAQFLMIDPKQVELSCYEGLPHLIEPIITDINIAIQKLRYMCDIMDDRYKRMKQGESNFPKLIVVIDELADLMMRSKYSVEESIVRVGQLGRAAGIHLIVATQRPTVNVCTGLIKANMPARIALAMASYRDSNVIEIPGADKLAGRGDALYQSPNNTIPPIRFQAAYIDEHDARNIVNWWKTDGTIVH
jgi:S-DNA-T family DNA segregation ATPase FtsK/SpoIIIE